MKIKIIKYLFLLIMMFVNHFVFAQKEFSDKINLFNIQGQKEGLWIEKSTYYIDYMYFCNGKPNGMFYRVKKSTNSLIYFGELTNGEYSGIWYYFSDYGHLLALQKDFKKNDKPIPAEHYARGDCPYQCYSITYYPNGVKKSEGILLWNEDPESDLTFEYGEWKYYDETGELIKTKVFK